MNPKKIAQTLQDRFSDGTVTFDDALFTELGVKPFLADTLGDRSLTITGASYTSDNRIVQIRGSITLLGVASVDALVEFDVDSVTTPGDATSTGGGRGRSPTIRRSRSCAGGVSGSPGTRASGAP